MLRYLWASPASLLGLLVVVIAGRRARLAVVDGILECHGPTLASALRVCTPLAGGAAAITLGHVVIARDQSALDATRIHERVHVRQYERWGPCFIPAYLLASAWVALRGGDPYRDNPFEREAFRIEGLSGSAMPTDRAPHLGAVGAAFAPRQTRRSDQRPAGR